MGSSSSNNLATPKADERNALVQRFFTGTGHTYDRIVGLCTFGTDAEWKREILTRLPERADRILDLACGTGILTFELARRYTEADIVGVDITQDYLDIAGQRLDKIDVSNVYLVRSRAEDVQFTVAFDCIVSSYLAKYADLEVLTRNCAKMLRKGGVLLMHDFVYPAHRITAWAWEGYFRLLPAFARWRYPEWEPAFSGLATLVRRTKWVEELRSAMISCQLSDIKVEVLSRGCAAIVSARNV